MEPSSRAQVTAAKLALHSQETGEMFSLAGEVLIGREVECDIQLRSIQVSRYHAKITVTQNCLLVEDLRSSNGTFINGVPIRGRSELNLGDQIAFDDVVFRVTSLHAGTAEQTVMAGGGQNATNDTTDRPAVEALLKHRDDKEPPAAMTIRKSDIGLAHKGTVAVPKVVSQSPDDLDRFKIQPANGSRSNTPQPASQASKPEPAKARAQVSKKPVNKASGQRSSALYILAGVAILALCLAFVFSR